MNVPLPSPPAIRLDRVDVAFQGRPALEDVSFEVSAGSFVALLGPNGAGKSTCLKVILGLVRPDAGTVAVFGSPPARREYPVAYVPQRIVIPRGFPITVLDVVIMGRFGVLGVGRRPGAPDREQALAALSVVGLGDLARRRFQDLSGGQQQRVLIARALCGDPLLLLLDEPTAGLDSGARARFYALVCDLQHQKGLTVLCATHDLDVVGDHADRAILLNRTIRAAGPAGEVMDAATLNQAYAFPVDHAHG
ncbi:MAG: metal ABC transporter ATP-binding protein [Gemmatimonadota bacterium]|nr:metal ABC transporter ATP-binding protein [Gemmatimonadota bacterium]